MFVGRVFPSVAIYRKATRMYSILKGFELNFTGNDPDRVTAICARECRRKIYASYFRGEKYFQIKFIKGTPHTCPLSYKNKAANARWLSEIFVNEIANDSN